MYWPSCTEATPRTIENGKRSADVPPENFPNSYQNKYLRILGSKTGKVHNSQLPTTLSLSSKLPNIAPLTAERKDRKEPRGSLKRRATKSPVVHVQKPKSHLPYGVFYFHSDSTLRIGHTEWIEGIRKVKQEEVDNVLRRLQRENRMVVAYWPQKLMKTECDTSEIEDISVALWVSLLASGNEEEMEKKRKLLLTNQRLTEIIERKQATLYDNFYGEDEKYYHT